MIQRKAFVGGVVAAGIWLTSTAVFAQNFYAGASLGQAKMKDACEGVTISCDNKDTAWRLFAGYQINRNFAAELGYADFGKSKASGTVSGASVDATAEANAWDLVGLGIWPIGNQFSIYGKLGAYHGKVKGSGTVSFGGATGTGNTSGSNNDVTYGVGAGFDFNRNLGLRAEYQKYKDVGDDNSGKSDIDVISIGVLYRFQ